MRGFNLASISLGGFIFWGILFFTKAWKLFRSRKVSSKLVFDLDLNIFCSKSASKSRSSMLYTPSLGKDRLISRKKNGSGAYSLALRRIFLGSHTGS
jgi:hypothetical protein